MTDMTVTALVPTYSSGLNTGTGGYSAMSAMGPVGASSGQMMLQIVLPYYESAKMAQDCAAWISNFIDTHDMNNPKNQDIVKANIQIHCYGDRTKVNNKKITAFDAIHGRSPAPSSYDYVTQQITEMSGSVTTPITAWAHFLWGNGADRTIKLENLGLRIQPNQIAPVMNIVKSGVVGTFNVIERFNRNTMLDGIIPAATVGNISLRTEGTLIISSSGAWNYNGVVRAYNDTYDANPGTYRGPIGEWSTKVLSKFGGTPYQISIPGQIDISGTGFR